MCFFVCINLFTLFTLLSQNNQTGMPEFGSEVGGLRGAGGSSCLTDCSGARCVTTCLTRRTGAWLVSWLDIYRECLRER